jgi:hypothetical protein
VELVVVAAAEREEVVEPLPAETPVGAVVELVVGVAADRAPLRTAGAGVSLPDASPVGRVEVLRVGRVAGPVKTVSKELRLASREIRSVCRARSPKCLILGVDHL